MHLYLSKLYCEGLISSHAVMGKKKCPESPHNNIRIIIIKQLCSTSLALLRFRFCWTLSCRFRVIIMRWLPIWCRLAFSFPFPWMGLCLFPHPMYLCNGPLDLNFLPLQKMWIGPGMPPLNYGFFCLLLH